MDRHAWLERHPFLERLAALHELAERGPVPVALGEPRFEDYAADYEAGVPLLASEAAGVDVVPAALAGVRALLDRLEAAPIPPAVRSACSTVRARLAGDGADEALRAALAGKSEGILPWLVWSALRPALAPVIHAFEAWRCDDDWRRPHCPTCGALPNMAHLVAVADGRQRRLVCGCCGTRWRYRRIGCPYCGNDSPERLQYLEIDGEAAFRLDICDACRGYTKTWLGDGDAALHLADWTTIHLDALAREHGLVRSGASLYAL